MMSSNNIIVRIVVGWVVVVGIGSQGCWGGDKTYFRGIVKIYKPICLLPYIVQKVHEYLFKKEV